MASVLHLGNVQFEAESTSDMAHVSNPDLVTTVAEVTLLLVWFVFGLLIVDFQLGQKVNLIMFNIIQTLKNNIANSSSCF